MKTFDSCISPSGLLERLVGTLFRFLFLLLYINRLANWLPNH